VSFLFLLISYKRGDAINIELQVQTIVPIIITKINPERLSGQNKKIVSKTKNKVKLVKILLFKVSLTEIFIISYKLFQCFQVFHQYSFKLSLILSKITIVSLIEYPKIVKSAVTKKVSRKLLPLAWGEAIHASRLVQWIASLRSQ
jgi:hypothetical protein